MGNEKSQPAGLTIDETTTEVTESWSLHGATCAFGSIPKISVFVTSTESSLVSCLEKFSKNVIIYRHPCILKYVASWKKGSKFYLATEQIQPLAQVLPSQTSLQICVGLQNILKALVFLHESGSVSHNNVCRAAVYVTQGGSWKLGGLEYVCRFQEMSIGYLEETRSSRYDHAISPDEAKQLPQPLSSIDCYAFGVLAQEVLVGKNNDDVPGMGDFLAVCKKQLQASNSEHRPSLSSLLTHPFFSHEFLNIHNFLLELPIKKDIDKQEFFRTVTTKLNAFPEDIVASQLGSLLLSRIVLLDSTAQHFLLPQVFIPRKEESCRDSLFSETTFRTHIVPRLLPLFCVRDVQIRLILLTHFHHYCSLFSQVQLQSRILPELLVGIKDTDDSLVSSTLRALAELVPVLGGAVVIGGKRSKLFADGRPKAVQSSTKHFNEKKHSKADTPLFSGREELVLPERPSPDGGEYVPTANATSEDETWPDWDYKEASEKTKESKQLETIETEEVRPVSLESPYDESSSAPETFRVEVKQLSTKGKSNTPDEYEVIFREMEPVISKPQIVRVDEVLAAPSNKFSLTTEVSDTADGWGEDFEDWNDTEEEVVNKSSTVEN